MPNSSERCLLCIGMMLWRIASERFERQVVREKASNLRDALEAVQEAGHCDGVRDGLDQRQWRARQQHPSKGQRSR
ncbi:hypothetical protein [Pantoea sp. 18069]|uniref:hypothetical protein n=1 Tax=Pantoea sp. 18069 TaxID=2681415 RepID=UPI001F26E10D|nr:hypothetical protein [Pantoea sp. 18069]